MWTKQKLSPQKNPRIYAQYSDQWQWQLKIICGFEYPKTESDADSSQFFMMRTTQFHLYRDCKAYSISVFLHIWAIISYLGSQRRLNWFKYFRTFWHAVFLLCFLECVFYYCSQGVYSFSNSELYYCNESWTMSYQLQRRSSEILKTN